MSDPLVTTQGEVAQVLGDPHPLAERLGCADGLAALPFGTTLAGNRVSDVPSLRRFLRDYHAEILLPVELPAIETAHGHASRYELRELIEFDRRLRDEPRLHEFAEASRVVGRSQLRRLLPMQDQRLVRRYWRAVEAGEAQAWHVLVYGMVLALFSLPLRQGLVNYSVQTTAGFIDSASRPLKLTEAQREELLRECTHDLPRRMRGKVEAAFPRLLVC
jgi:urease accessory protein UreF